MQRLVRFGGWAVLAVASAVALASPESPRGASARSVADTAAEPRVLVCTSPRLPPVGDATSAAPGDSSRQATLAFVVGHPTLARALGAERF